MYWLVIEVQGELGLISLQERYLDQRLEVNPEEIVFYSEFTSINEKDVREQIAEEFDRLASQRNPDDPEGSKIHSQWCEQVAHRIRNPERYSGVAKNGE